MRLSPRDLNYPDIKEASCCVLRHELLQNYVFNQSIEIASQNLEEEEAKNKEKENS